MSWCVCIEECNASRCGGTSLLFVCVYVVRRGSILLPCVSISFACFCTSNHCVTCWSFEAGCGAAETGIILVERER